MLNEAKPAIQSKTVWFNVVSGVLALASVIPPPFGMIVSAVGNIVLRVWFTDTPVKGLVSADD
ncbi:hypothetical protein BH20PSE1_BH20PSE1_01200 [soil metagenome]